MLFCVLFPFCVVLCIVFVYMCTEILPPGGYPIAVKYIISYHIFTDRTGLRLSQFAGLHRAAPLGGTREVPVVRQDASSTLRM